jgi:hypothetical protein
MRFLITIKGYMDPEEFEYFNSYVRDFKEWSLIEYALDRFEGKYIYAEFVYWEDYQPGVYEELRMIVEGHFDEGTHWDIKNVTSHFSQGELTDHYAGFVS